MLGHFGSSTNRGLDILLEPAHVTSIILHAEKRRRRRKIVETNDGGSVENSSSESTSRNDLPDFDLDEEQEETPQPKRRIITNPDEITPAMMGNANAPVSSIKDLIADRSLEAKFEFDEEDKDDSLPDLIALSRQRQGGGGGEEKKMSRKAERRANAIAAKEAERADEESIFDNLPFVSDEKGKVQPIKVLEAGAWAGIFLLFAWEVYLNSPFFDRAAPMAPVVFD